jgi:lysophospholipase L1-like esterase
MDNYAIQNHAPVVFFGDSITDYWPLGTFFAGKGYVNRGIGGQTTEQMIVRFQQDVVDINPDVVVILAGANDIRGITGTKRVDQIEQNIRTMAELAHLHGIRVVLCSVLPVAKSVWTPAQKAKILTINAWIRNYASENQFPFVDYYDAMKDPVGNLPDALSVDGLHPSLAGYKVMAPLAEHSIEQVLKR